MSLKVFVPASYPLLTYTWAFIFSILKCFYHISGLWFPKYFKQNQGFILTGTFLFEIFRLNLHCNIGQNIRSSSNETNVQWHFCKQRQSTYNHQNLIIYQWQYCRKEMQLYVSIFIQMCYQNLQIWLDGLFVSRWQRTVTRIVVRMKLKLQWRVFAGCVRTIQEYFIL